MVLSCVFYTSEDTLVPDGKTFNFWAGGHHVYMNCVLLANLIILKMQHNITGFNLFIIGGLCVSGAGAMVTEGSPSSHVASARH